MPTLTLADVLTLVAVIALLTVVAVLSAALMRRRRTVWKRFAEKHRLDYVEGPSGLTVHGAVRGRSVELSVLRESSDTGVLGVEEIRLEVELRGRVPEDLDVFEARGPLGEARRAWETERVPTGDVQLDEAAVIKGRDPEKIRGYLEPRRRQTLLKLIADCEFGTVGISRARLFWRHREMTSDLDELEGRLQWLLDAAEALDGPRSAGE